MTHTITTPGTEQKTPAHPEKATNPSRCDMNSLFHRLTHTVCRFSAVVSRPACTRRIRQTKSLKETLRDTRRTYITTPGPEARTSPFINRATVRDCIYNIYGLFKLELKIESACSAVQIHLFITSEAKWRPHTVPRLHKTSRLVTVHRLHLSPL